MPLLIFDCDGVLVDSEVLAHAAMADLLAELGKPISMPDAFKIFAGKRLSDALAAAEAWLGAPIPPGVAARAGERLLATFRRKLKPVGGVRQAIEAMPFPRCVASSSTPERLAVSLEATGLAPLFGANVFSAEQVERGKPAPDLFLFAARAMGATAAECVVIEDSALGVAAARAAGMTVIGFIGASHGNGDMAAKLAAAGADVVLNSMAALPAAVERLLAKRR